MSEIAQALAALRRPRLLLDAARHGSADYRRDRDLTRLLRAARPPEPAAAVAQLLIEENRLEEARRAGDGSYSPRRHVDLLSALLAEARALVAPCAASV
jgi:hypothetical protein